MADDKTLRVVEANRCYLTVNGEIFDDFTDYSVSSNLLHAADGFHFSTPWMSGRDGTIQVGEYQDRGLVEGAIVRVHVQTPNGLLLQHTGVVEEIQYVTQRGGAGSMVHVVGRDHMAPIVDGCTFPNVAMENTTFKEVAIKALAPYGFTGKHLLISNDANRQLLTGKVSAGTTLSPDAPVDIESLKLDKAKPHAGETVYQYLSRHARRFGLMIWGTADGSIIIGRPIYEQKPLYVFQCMIGPGPAGNNVEQAQRKRSVQQRPSEVHVYGHSGHHDFTNTPVHAIVYDDYVKSCGIYKPLVVHDNNAKTADQAKQRALYEMGVRRQTGDVVSFTVKGHMASDGAVYAIDTMEDVRWDAGEVLEPRYVVRRTFTRTRGQGPGGGTHTTVELVPKYALVLGEPQYVTPQPKIVAAAAPKLDVVLAISNLANGSDITTQKAFGGK